MPAAEKQTWKNHTNSDTSQQSRAAWGCNVSPAAQGHRMSTDCSRSLLARAQAIHGRWMQKFVCHWGGEMSRCVVAAVW